MPTVLDGGAEGAACFAGTKGRDPFIRYRGEEVVTAERPGAPVLRHDTSMLSEQVGPSRTIMLYDNATNVQPYKTWCPQRPTHIRYAVLHLGAEVRNFFIAGDGHR